MKTILQWFKCLFLIGLISLFLSFFFEWFSFRVFSETEMIVSWQFYLFNGWVSPLNDYLRPEQISIPFFINVMAIILIVLTGYIVFFMSIENATSLEKYRTYAYINGALLILVLCYILLFPFMYLLPNDLYYPLFHVTNPDSGVTTAYSVGFGYILQIISFPLLFPYSIFYISTILKFGQEDNNVEQRVRNLVEQYQEAIDLDKYIADEIARNGG